MITLPDVQAILISKLKSSPDITSKLKNSNEIREIEWVGSVYTFPNVRVRVENFKRERPDCDRFDIIANVFIFGEDASSIITNVIASSIFNLFDTRQLKDAKLISCTRIKAEQFGADYSPEYGTWKSEVRLIFQVS